MESYYQDYFHDIYKYFFFRVRDYDLAMDLTQTTFLKVATQKKSLDTSTALRFFYTVARNTLIDHRRKHTTLSLEGMESYSEKIPLHPHEGVEEQVLARESLEQVHTLLNQLPERDREYLTMYYLEELSYEEIAQRTGSFTVTIRQIISRARKKLSQLYEKSLITTTSHS
jgi:RNA polymerase sigma-70 factor (ECF subfamily)